MTFDDAVARLYQFIDYERVHKDKYNDAEFNLDGFRAFVKQLGNPHESYRHVHVTGTDGKGSVCRMLSSILQHAGLKTGLYTSPHLECITERIQINGEPIPRDAFARLLGLILPVAEGQGVSTVAARSGGYATVFEILTAMAWMYFKEQAIDWAVDEVGLGGRLDATNIITPHVSVIMPIDLEHTNRLGNTLDAVAREKLGIVKPGVPVVVAPQKPGMRALFDETAAGLGSRIVWAEEHYEARNVTMSPEGLAFDVHSRSDEWSLPVELNARGRHQVSNALASIAAIGALQAQGLLDHQLNEAIREGLAHAEFPGRCEVFKAADRGGNIVTVVLDGAHTRQALGALGSALDRLWPNQLRTFVIGSLRDKKPDAFREVLFRPGDRVIATRAADNPRALTAEELAGQLGFPCEVNNSSDEALEQALEEGGGERIVVVTGSIYLIGGLRQRLKTASRPRNK